MQLVPQETLDMLQGGLISYRQVSIINLIA